MAESILRVTRRDLMAALRLENSPPSMKTWAILDGARDERIYGAVDRSYQDKCCLFAGELSSSLQMVAPYLVQLDAGDPLTNWVLDQGWGNAWGVFLQSDASLKTLRQHFRRFLRVTDQAGKRLLFRYYDPRVLRIYLPTCNSAELETVFGPVNLYLVEAESPDSLLRYSFTGWTLTTERDVISRALDEGG